MTSKVLLKITTYLWWIEDRDSLTLLEDLGIKAAMPSFMKKDEKHMSDIDANTSRMVTKASSSIN